MSAAFFHRCVADKFTCRFLELTKYNGTPTIYDTDDLVFEDSVSQYFSSLNRKRKFKPKHYREMMQLCDAVSVSTSYLKTRAEQFHDNVFLLRNALSQEYLASAGQVYRIKEHMRHTYTTVAYMSGSGTHDRDFAVVRPTLLRLMSQIPNLKTLIVGPLNGLDEFNSFGERFVHLDFVDYEEFPELFKYVDINLVPLELGVDFCQAKSELKFIEAGACGVPSVLTATESQKDVINHSDNGFLVRSNDDWYSVLRSAIESPDRMLQVALNARHFVLENYSPAVRARDYLRVLQQVAEQNAEKSKSGRVNLLGKSAAVHWSAAARNIRSIAADYLK